MRTIVKHRDKRKSKRDVFAELTEGTAALAESRGGKRTLRTHAVEFKPAPTITPQELIRVRETERAQHVASVVCRVVYLRTNVRTLACPGLACGRK